MQVVFAPKEGMDRGGGKELNRFQESAVQLYSCEVVYTAPLYHLSADTGPKHYMHLNIIVVFNAM